MATHVRVEWATGGKPLYNEGPCVTTPVNEVPTGVLRELHGAIERELKERERLRRVLDLDSLGG